MPGGVYLYCIGRAEQLTGERVSNLDARPPDGSPTAFRTIRHGDLAALVSDTEVQQFEIQRDALMAHHHVLQEAMKLGDILPVSFGTVAATEGDIVQSLLQDSANQLHANLEHVRGRVELSVRVMWQQDRLFQEIATLFDEIRVLRDAIAGTTEEQTYYERIRLGELTRNAIIQMSEFERDQILEVLSPISADIQITPGTSDMLLLNGSFLVDREREPEFDNAVQEVATPRQERMIFRYLGPLPPASFVSVAVNAEQ